jgi:hypothetical protein
MAAFEPLEQRRARGPQCVGAEDAQAPLFGYGRQGWVGPVVHPDESDQIGGGGGRQDVEEFLVAVTGERGDDHGVVTGICGFTGSHVRVRIDPQNHQVIAVLVGQVRETAPCSPSTRRREPSSRGERFRKGNSGASERMLSVPAPCHCGHTRRRWLAAAVMIGPPRSRLSPVAPTMKRNVNSRLRGTGQFVDQDDNQRLGRADVNNRDLQHAG